MSNLARHSTRTREAGGSGGGGDLSVPIAIASACVAFAFSYAFRRKASDEFEDEVEEVVVATPTKPLKKTCVTSKPPEVSPTVCSYTKEQEAHDDEYDYDDDDHDYQKPKDLDDSNHYARSSITSATSRTRPETVTDSSVLEGLDNLSIAENSRGEKEIFILPTPRESLSRCPSFRSTSSSVTSVSARRERARAKEERVRLLLARAHTKIQLDSNMERIHQVEEDAL